jgi:hypothetical protein
MERQVLLVQAQLAQQELPLQYRAQLAQQAHLLLAQLVHLVQSVAPAQQALQAPVQRALLAHLVQEHGPLRSLM